VAETVDEGLTLFPSTWLVSVTTASSPLPSPPVEEREKNAGRAVHGFKERKTLSGKSLLVTYLFAVI